MKNPVRKKILLSLLLIILLLPTAVFAVAEADPVTEKLDVRARVSAREEHFNFDFTSDLTTSTITADQTINYILTYGSRIDYGTEMTLEVEWSLGSISGQSLQSFQILNYVPGSATRDYWGDAQPIVDIVNRKILWKKTRFPPNTIDKQVRFKLKTPSIFVTDKNVDVWARARLTTPEVVMPWITLNHTYQPGDFIRREVSGMQILSADLRRITDTSFAIFLVTSVPTRATIYYGTEPDNLNKTYTDDTLSEQKLLVIEDLLPATAYYFRIMIENENLIQRKTPEVFTVVTAATSLISLIDIDRMLISSRGVLLKAQNSLGLGSTVIVPSRVPVELFLPFIKDTAPLVFISLSDKRVLGLSTDGAIPSPEGKIRLLETQPGIFTGSFTSPPEKGSYDLMIETQDVLGHANRDILTTLLVSDPVRIITDKGMPIESALVYIERYNPSAQNFEYFPASSFGSMNPIYSDEKGFVDLVLPEGEYQINVNAIGYESEQIRFLFSPEGTKSYPVITLVKAPFSLLTYFAYYKAVFTDSFSFAVHNIDNLSQSYRFLDLSILVSLLILTILSTILNLRRIKLTAEALYVAIEKRFRKLFKIDQDIEPFIGFAEDESSGLPIAGAIVTASVKGVRKKILKDITNLLGEFQLQLGPGQVYEIIIKKPGYSMLKFAVDLNEVSKPDEPYKMQKQVRYSLPQSIEFILVLFGSVTHALSDMLLFSAGILNLIFFILLGERVLPLLIITILNAILWMNFHWYSYKRRQVTRE